jgi:transposase
MKSLSPAKRDDIVSHLLNSTRSLRDIALITGTSKSTVARIAQEVQPNKENLKKGQPSKLTAKDTRAILSSITTGKASNAVQATKHINSIISNPVSVQTVRNTLKKAHFKAVVKKKKPLLREDNKKARLAWAQKYRNWTIEDWTRVLWSDEVKVNLLGSDGQEYVWKKAGEPLSQREVKGTLKFGGGKMNVWGCMGWNGVGILTEVEGNMDAEQFVDIMDSSLLRSIEMSGIPQENVIFQQDNDPKHTSRLATDWFKEHQITLMDWPSQSPDLNPTEHLWGHLKRRLNSYEKPPSGVWELWDRLAAEWGKIEVEVCQKLIESMPRRIEAVIKAKGGNTKY